MTVEGIAPEGTGDSLDDAVTAAAAQDTSTTESHTPETTQEPDIDALVAQLEAVKDKIPPEKLQFLNSNLQQGYTRRVNLLNRSVEPVAKKMMEEAGVQLPEGKTVMDLLTDGDGTEFFRVWDEHQQRQLRPVLEFTNQQKMAAQISEWAGYARQQYPVVDENFEEISKIISQDPDLLALAKIEDWKGLPMVMQGVGYKVAFERQKSESEKQRKLLEAADIAKKTGRRTSLAGGPAAKTSGKPDGDPLDAAIAKAWDTAMKEA